MGISVALIIFCVIIGPFVSLSSKKLIRRFHSVGLLKTTVTGVLTGCLSAYIVASTLSHVFMDAWLFLAVALVLQFIFSHTTLLLLTRQSKNTPQSKAQASESSSNPDNVKTENPPAQQSPEDIAPAIVDKQRIFLSYRRRDSADVTGRIYDRLIAHFGEKNVYKDVDSVPIGVDFRTHIATMIDDSSVVIAVIGPNWIGENTATNERRIDNTKDYVKLELETAFQQTKTVIPLTVLGAQMPLEQQLPKEIAKITYINGLAIRSDPDFNIDIDRLIKGIERTQSKSAEAPTAHGPN